MSRRCPGPLGHISTWLLPFNCINTCHVLQAAGGSEDWSGESPEPEPEGVGADGLQFRVLAATVLPLSNSVLPRYSLAALPGASGAQSGRPLGLGAAEPLAQRPEGEVGKGLRLRKPCSGGGGRRGAVPSPHPAPSSL